MIKSTIIASSITEQNKRIVTFELEFPRWILAEFNTHRVLSRNSASSRAIPIDANIQNILNNTAIPVEWGINQPGMVAESIADEETARRAREVWVEARNKGIEAALSLARDLKIHKQIANRLIENFTYQKVITTATDWNNFFWLRNHQDAQPEIRELAKLMLVDFETTTSVELYEGEWHTPYYRSGYWAPHMSETLQEALQISASCCAQVSYRKQDDSLEKAKLVYEKLNLESTTQPKHASPVEHQATPIPQHFSAKVRRGLGMWDYGITHKDKFGSYWSGNFNGWIQHRQLIEGESVRG
jgi:hypothetical protein